MTTVPAAICTPCELRRCHACEELATDPLHPSEVVECQCRHDTRRTR